MLTLSDAINMHGRRYNRTAVHLNRQRINEKFNKLVRNMQLTMQIYCNELVQNDFFDNDLIC